MTRVIKTKKTNSPHERAGPLASAARFTQTSGVAMDGVEIDITSFCVLCRSIEKPRSPPRSPVNMWGSVSSTAIDSPK